MTRAFVLGCCALVSCSSQPDGRTPITRAPVVVVAKAHTIAVSEIAALAGSWTGNLFRFHAVAEGEAYVSVGLTLIHVQDARVTSQDALSRGLPVQTDPCFAPAISELRATTSGELVLTLADAGSPHFTGGCRDRVPGDDAYAWRGERWVPVEAPAWAVTSSRQLFAESRVGNQTVRLMGPSVGPESDGFTVPTEYEYLDACFRPGSRSTLAGWNPPALPTLPDDLCVEGVRFGATTQDALYLGRTKDGQTWLERQAPGQPPRRTRLDVPASCNVHSAPHVVLPALDRGTLELDVHCNDTPKDDESWRGHRLRFAYALEGSVWQLAPQPAGEIREPLAPFELEPDFRLTDAQPPALAHGTAELLPAVTQVLAFGRDRALAERNGHVFLLGPPAQSAPLVIDGERPGPGGQVLSAPPNASGACRNGLRILARVPAAGAAADALAAKRAALVALAGKHPAVTGGEDPFLEFRVGDDAWLARAWPAPEDDGATEATTRAVTGWAKAAGLDFSTSCLFAAPSGEGRAYRIVGGQIEPVRAFHD